MNGRAQRGYLDHAQVQERGEVLLRLVGPGSRVLREPGGQLAVAGRRVLLEEVQQPVQGAAAAQEEQPVLDGVEGDGRVVVAGGDPAAYVPHPVVVLAPPGGGGDGQVRAAYRIGDDALGEPAERDDVEPRVAGPLLGDPHLESAGPVRPSSNSPSATPVKVENGLVLQTVR